MGKVKYKQKLHNRMLEEVISNDGFVATFCAKAGICRKTFYNWLDKYKTFRRTYDRAVEVRKDRFQRRVQLAAFDPEKHPVNNQMVSLLAVNCHGWVTKKDQAKAGQQDAADKIAKALEALAEALPD